VVLEYMACGKPVVATNVGGNTESIMDGQTGLLVPARDPAALSAAMLRLLDDPRLAAEMGKAGRERVLKYFTLEKMIENTHALYSSLLGAGARRSPSILSAVTRGADLHRLAKISAVKALSWSGVTLIMRKAQDVKRGILMLAYHRVKNVEFDPLDMCLNESLFESNLEHLKRNYNIISFEKAVELLGEGGEIPERAAVLTFDDGYRDNYTVAFPVAGQVEPAGHCVPVSERGGRKGKALVRRYRELHGALPRGRYRPRLFRDGILPA